MEIRYPEYGNCIANLACSLLRYYGCSAPNPTLPQADVLLNREYKNVVLLLLDGMGMCSLEKLLSPNGIFRRNLRCKYSSTFPPTTVAATTAVMSGLYPNQSAWLGWVGYFDEIDRNVVYYTNKDNDTGEKITDMNAAFTFVPFADIFEPIRSKGISAHWLCSWREPHPRSFGEMTNEIARLCALEQRHFIYAYWEEPDNTMHKKGVHAQETGTLLQEIEEEIERLAENMEDTLLIVTADHGLVDTQTTLLSEDAELMDCLVRPPSMESRAMNFFVKDECVNRFEALFAARYGIDYRLLTMAEGRKLFGNGRDHPRLSRMLGNYLAVAEGSRTLAMKDKKFSGEHGGMTADEMIIPLIAIET